MQCTGGYFQNLTYIVLEVINFNHLCYLSFINETHTYRYNAYIQQQK